MSLYLDTTALVNAITELQNKIDGLSPSNGRSVGVFLTIIIFGQCDAKNIEKCLCSHHNIIAFIKQISLFDTVLIMTNI